MFKLGSQGFCRSKNLALCWQTVLGVFKLGLRDSCRICGKRYGAIRVYLSQVREGKDERYK